MTYYMFALFVWYVLIGVYTFLSRSSLVFTVIQRASFIPFQVLFYYITYHLIYVPFKCLLSKKISICYTWVSQATGGFMKLLLIQSYHTHHTQMLKEGETHLLTYLQKLCPRVQESDRQNLELLPSYTNEIRAIFTLISWMSPDHHLQASQNCIKFFLHFFE